MTQSRASVCNGVMLEAWVAGEGKELCCRWGDEQLTLARCFRHLSGRRLTLLAYFNGTPIVAKFFYGKQYSKYFSQETSSLSLLAKSTVQTPKLLFSDCNDSEQIAIIAFEYLESAVTFGCQLERSDSEEEQHSLLTSAIHLFADMHNTGIIQLDPHLDNLLVKEGVLYMIDAGQMAAIQEDERYEKGLDNLALFVAQLPVRFDKVAYDVLSMYMQSCEPFRSPSGEAWAEKVHIQRSWRVKKFVDKKVFRNCSDFLCDRSFWRFMMVRRDCFDEEMAQALKKPDQLFQDASFLKKGRTATVAIVVVGGRQFVLKRYNIKKPFHSFIRGLIWSRAAVSWKNGYLLKLFGISTAEPIAMLEERIGPLRRRSYLLTEYIEGRNVIDSFNDEQRSETEKEKLAEKIIQLFSDLKSAAIFHGDCKGYNILEGDRGVSFIDLDGMLFYRDQEKFAKAHNRDWERFMFDMRGLTQYHHLFGCYSPLVGPRECF